MKDILKQFAKVFMAIICCIIQCLALSFVGIGWIFNKLGELLTDANEIVMNKVASKREEEHSKDVPLEG